VQCLTLPDWRVTACSRAQVLPQSGFHATQEVLRKNGQFQLQRFLWLVLLRIEENWAQEKPTNLIQTLRSSLWKC
jgi:hypothetical protein